MTRDVNVLLVAFRADYPHRAQAYAWLSRAITARADGDTLELLPMVTASFLRIAMHPPRCSRGLRQWAQP